MLSTSLLVVDASAVVELLLTTDRGRAVKERLQDETSLHCPGLLDIEVLSALRRMRNGGRITTEEADDALQKLTRMPVQRYNYRPFLQQVWSLRDNFTPYDATYVALARELDATLITTDRRLSRSLMLEKLQVRWEVPA